MSEWWTYRPSDFLLFSPRSYWRLFELHNQAWWPMGVAALLAALAAAAWSWRTRCAAPALALLGAAWLFVAWAFLLQRYAGINWAAPWFAAAFALQGALLLALAALRPPLQRGTRARIGAALSGLALVGWPLLAPIAGRPLAQAEVFGLAPDPTVLAALGALLLAAPDRPGARRLWQLCWLVPLAWSALSGLTLWLLGAMTAPLLPVVAALALSTLWLRSRR